MGGVSGHLVMARSGAHIELLDFPLELGDTVVKLVDVLVLPAGHVTELILYVVVVVLHAGELLMFTGKMLLECVVFPLCHFKAIMHGGDLCAEDIIVLGQ